MAPLTRKDFYELAEYCHKKALDLARHDQTRVSLKHCHEFNAWLARVKSFEKLGPRLRGLAPARPIARWQLMVLGGVLGLVMLISLPSRFDRSIASFAFYAYLFALIIFYFVPERLYGTTVELLEGKMLRVVESLDQILLDEEMGFTEAVYFKVKDNLEAARRELRQQIDLAHRRWR